jgi:modified peptide precursor CbpA
MRWTIREPEDELKSKVPTESDGKRLRGIVRDPSEPFCRFLAHNKESIVKKIVKKTAPKKTDHPVIAYRKSCKTTGTGLSHYILADRKAK